MLLADPLPGLLASNAAWVKSINASNPTFFQESAKLQKPKILWIGCADSRVPESVIMACAPGDIFVHRNVANQFIPDDDTALAVLQYAVGELGITNIVIAGHTNCGGVKACYGWSATANTPGDSAVHRWLEPLTNLARKENIAHLRIPEAVALRRLAESNVKMQFDNLINSETILHAWRDKKNVQVHGWLYELETGTIRDLGLKAGPTATVRSAP